MHNLIHQLQSFSCSLLSRSSDIGTFETQINCEMLFFLEGFVSSLQILRKWCLCFFFFLSVCLRYIVEMSIIPIKQSSQPQTCVTRVERAESLEYEHKSHWNTSEPRLDKSVVNIKACCFLKQARYQAALPNTYGTLKWSVEPSEHPWPWETLIFVFVSIQQGYL